MLPVRGALREVDGVGLERAPCRPRLAPRRRRLLVIGADQLAVVADLGDAVGDVLEHVEARDALLLEQVHGVRGRLAVEARRGGGRRRRVLAGGLDAGRVARCRTRWKAASAAAPARACRQRVDALGEERFEVAAQQLEVDAERRAGSARRRGRCVIAKRTCSSVRYSWRRRARRRRRRRGFPGVLSSVARCDRSRISLRLDRALQRELLLARQAVDLLTFASAVS